MLPLRLVIDTNVVVSAALKPESLQRTALLIATKKPARLYVSRAILDEYEDVLSRPELKIRKGQRLQLLQFIYNISHLVTPVRRLDVCSDPDDNVFLECADKGRRRLPDHGKQQALSALLEEDEDHHIARFPSTRSAPSPRLRGSSRQAVQAMWMQRCT